MSKISVTGSDVIQIGGRNIADTADGDVGVLDFPNNVVEGKTGKNGNTTFAYNSTGLSATLTLRLLRGSADDKYLNSELALFLSDPPSYAFLRGEFVKRIGDGEGETTNDVYSLNGGVIQKQPNTKDNVEGDTEAAITEWSIFFSNTARSLT